MSGPIASSGFVRLGAAALGATLAIGLGGCQPPPVKKPPAKTEQVAEPRWRHIRSDGESATYMTPAIQSVGSYKRFWLAEVYAKPLKVTVRGDTGIAIETDDLMEVDCAEIRVRVLQRTFKGENDWSATETPDKPKWRYVNPDALNGATLRHACNGERLTGTGYASMEKARLAYHASLTAPKDKAEAKTP